MEEFYNDHTHDPDTNGKDILDLFMGDGSVGVSDSHVCNPAIRNLITRTWP